MELMSQFTVNNTNSVNGKKKRRKASAALGKAPSPKRQLTVSEDNKSFTMVSRAGDNNADDVSNDDYDSDNSLEEYSDEDVENMENVIDQNVNKSIVSDVNNDNDIGDMVTSDAPPSPSTIAARADDIFCRDYIVDPPVLHLKPVSEMLAATLTTWCHVPPKKEEIKEMFKASLVPINVEGLHPVCINESLYRKLPMKAKINDQRLHGLNTFLACGTEIFNDFCQIKAGLKYTTDKSNMRVTDNAEIVIDGLTIDFPGIHCLLGRSICLLTAAHSNILQKRRVSLQAYIDKKFHYFTRDSNPVTTQLLGADLEQKISDSMKTSDAARQLTYRPVGCRGFP